MRRVLIIEDDIREVAAVALERIAGWIVITASSWQGWITAAQREHPDAILMPGVDGPTTFREMQTTDGLSKVPVIFLTAKVQGVDRRQLAIHGAAAILSKPFDPCR